MLYLGRVAEWLGRGLQNLLRWFDPTRDLSCYPLDCVIYRIYFLGSLVFFAWVAELVDALVSKTNDSDIVPVRFRLQVLFFVWMLE